MLLSGALDGKAFLAFVREVLVPAMRPGQVLVMDNLSVHKAPGVVAALENAGCHVVFLPSYSPDFNPIERCWSKVKWLVRSAEARDDAELIRVVGEAWLSLRRDDIQGAMRSAGY